MQPKALKLLTGIGVLLLIGSITCPGGEVWTNGQNARAVWGQDNFKTGISGTSNQKLNQPDSIAEDPTSGKVFVSDTGNHRVLRFASFEALSNGASPEVVLGQGDFDTTVPAGTRSRMSGPKGISIDSSGRLWVADSNNHRVLRFDDASGKVSGANADGVLGQPDFGTTELGGGSAGMGFVVAVLADSGGRLWVSDWDNERLTRFDGAALKANGADADGVLGQLDFEGGNEGTSQMSLKTPAGLAMDAAGNLWVADIYQVRVLMFQNAASKVDGGNADRVLGQLQFATANMNQTRWGLSQPSGLAIDSNGTLWVTDQLFHRVLRFANPALSGDGASAANVLGQPHFEIAEWGTTRSSMNTPEGVCVDGEGVVWVADRENNRLLKFEQGGFQPDGLIGLKRSALLGDDVYDRQGIGQEIDLALTGTRPGKFHFMAENDGSSVDDLRIRGSRSNRKFEVKYFRLSGGRENVTADISSLGYKVSNLSPGRAMRFLGKVTAASSRVSSRNTTKTLKTLVLSDSEPLRDRMNVKVTCKP